MGAKLPNKLGIEYMVEEGLLFTVNRDFRMDLVVRAGELPEAPTGDTVTETCSPM